jgi:iron complex outermembrane receptor protein
VIKLRISLFFATSSLAFSAAGHAQETPPPAGNEAAPAAARPETSGVADIVVTVQRRAENLTSVPLSISAQTGAQLAASGIKDLSDVRFNTPGMLSASGTGYVQIYIRGIGNGVFVGAEPSIATFYDDVPHVYGSLVEDLVNVERVEVLKGAQGGLYGRNASGGVINIITRQPSDKFAATVRLTGATRSTFQGSAYVNMPLNDRIAWNFSLTRNWHGPYRSNHALREPYNSSNAANPALVNQLAHPGKLNNQNVWSFDTKLRVRLADNFKITLGGDYTQDQDASGNGWIPVDPMTSYAIYKAIAPLFGVTPLPPDIDHGIVNGRPTAQWRNPGKNESFGAIPNKSWTEDYGTSLKAELGLEGVDITSITALRYNNSQFQGDIGASKVPIAGFSTNFRRHYFYQELRAVSKGSGPFRWLGGATYFKDHVNAFTQGITLGVPGAITTSKLNTWNWSVYGQASYDITDHLTFQASLRYAHEKKTVDFPAIVGKDYTGVTKQLSAISDLTKVHKWIPAATLSYKVPGGTVYARYAKGFKTGGPNPLVRPDRLPPTTKPV